MKKTFFTMFIYHMLICIVYEFFTWDFESIFYHVLVYGAIVLFCIPTIMDLITFIFKKLVADCKYGKHTYANIDRIRSKIDRITQNCKDEEEIYDIETILEETI